MVVVEFSYEEMKKIVDIPLEDMIEGLSSLGAPCEYEENTKKILAELTPNSPDWYSMEGLSRALKAYYKNERPSYSAKRSDYTVIVDKSVSKVRPYTVCAVAKGIKFNDQRIRDVVLLQEKESAACDCCCMLLFVFLLCSFLFYRLYLYLSLRPSTVAIFV